jgi:hypothetical protein
VCPKYIKKASYPYTASKETGGLAKIMTGTQNSRQPYES